MSEEHDTTAVEEIAQKHTTGPRKATFADLRGKPTRRHDFHVTVADGDGNEVELQMSFRGISSTAYDDLLAAHPPTQSEKIKGAIYNGKTFPSALIAAVSLEPKLSYEEVLELSTSDSWSQGEFADLFFNAQKVCNSGLDVGFNSRG